MSAIVFTNLPTLAHAHYLTSASLLIHYISPFVGIEVKGSNDLKLNQCS